VFALTRILVPTNLGEPSKTAIKYGVAFARQFAAQLYLVHVLGVKELDAMLETERVLETLDPDATATLAEEPSAAQLAHNAAREDLAKLLTPEEERATRAEYLLRGAPNGAADAIVACAQELGVELVVIGKHQQGFVDHLVAGSVTENVIRRAPCPVLVVHHPEHDFVRDER
jgi:nucleotide-binding universal stress UspA family protein